MPLHPECITARLPNIAFTLIDDIIEFICVQTWYILHAWCVEKFSLPAYIAFLAAAAGETLLSLLNLGLWGGSLFLLSVLDLTLTILAWMAQETQ